MESILGKKEKEKVLRKEEKNLRQKEPILRGGCAQGSKVGGGRGKGVAGSSSRGFDAELCIGGESCEGGVDSQSQKGAKWPHNCLRGRNVGLKFAGGV